MKSEIPMSDLMRKLTLTVKVTGVRRFAVRLSVGVALMRIAARIIGFGKVAISRG